MIRALARLALALIANALGLIVAAWILDDMALDVSGFVLALAIFTGVEVLVSPLIAKMALQGSPALSGSSALVATFVALVVTAWVSDGLRISGGTTWVLATVIVWAATLLAGVLLPLFLFKRVLAERRR